MIDKQKLPQILASDYENFVDEAVLQNAIEKVNSQWTQLYSYLKWNQPDYATHQEMDILGSEVQVTEAPELYVHLSSGDTIKITVVKSHSESFDSKLNITIQGGTKDLPSLKMYSSGFLSIGAMNTDMETLLYLAKLDLPAGVIDVTGPEFKDELLGKLQTGLLMNSEADIPTAKDLFVSKSMDWSMRNAHIRIGEMFVGGYGSGMDKIPHFEDHLDVTDLSPESLLGSQLPRIYLDNGDFLIFGSFELRRGRDLVLSYFSSESEHLGSSMIKARGFVRNGDSSLRLAEVNLIYEGTASKAKLVTLLAKIGYENPIDKQKTADSVSFSEKSVRSYLKYLGISQADQSKHIAEMDIGSPVMAKLLEISLPQDLPQIFQQETLEKYFPALALYEINELILHTIPVVGFVAADTATFDKSYLTFMFDNYSQYVDIIIDLLLETGLIHEPESGRYEVVASVARKIKELFGGEA